MSLKDDLQSDFDTMQADFGISTTFEGTTVAITGVRNSMDKDIVYTELANKSVEYKYTIWYDVSEIAALSLTVPDIHDEITIDGSVYLVAKRTYDPLEALVALDMVEQYG